MRMRDRPEGRPVMRQVWEQLGFLHWPVDAAALARLLPPGLEVDLFEGVAYVGIIPFTIPLTEVAAIGARMAPAFHELNVRTYVHRGGRDPGVWFFSLDATSALAVTAARAMYRLPYFDAAITFAASEEPLPAIEFRSQRSDPRGTTPAHSHLLYKPADGVVSHAQLDTLEFFL